MTCVHPLRCVCSVLLLGLTASCQEPRSDEVVPSPTGAGGSGVSTTTAPDSGGGTGMPQDGSTQGSSGNSDEGGIKLDVAGVLDVPPAVPCGAVDFLFVVDNSGSMREQQERLIASFPLFMGAVQQTLDTVDSIHVGVVTSDEYESNESGCRDLGALVTRTESPCGPFTDGNRYLTEADDLDTDFACIANVGTDGALLEMPVSALLEAVSPQLNEDGACNDGFLRSDALLVVVVITDDVPFFSDMDDAHILADTSSWYDALVDAKGGNPNGMVVIGFVPWDDLECMSSVYAIESPNLIRFVEGFGDGGVLASVCSDDYGAVFESALSVIDESCDNFVPEG